jgi:hypothetical protein
VDTLGLVKDVSIIVAGVVTLITFMTGVLQYVRQGRQHRATQFVEMRRRFLEDPSFREILNLLGTNDERLASLPIQDRRNFVGFLEEVALMVNSEVLSARVAHYMFGYYVLLVDGSESFWEGLDRSSEYWSVFRGFAQTMKTQRGLASRNPKELRF